MNQYFQIEYDTRSPSLFIFIEKSFEIITNTFPYALPMDQKHLTRQRLRYNHSPAVAEAIC